MSGHREVLEFWFGAPGPAALVAARQAALWWGNDAAVDRAVAERFGPLLERAIAGGLDAWPRAAEGRLALVVVLDQFSRHVFRGTARAFAQDAKALALTLDGIECGHDRGLGRLERVFFYLPLEHAESLEMQQRCVEIFAEMRDAAPEDERAIFETFLDFAERHLQIITRFGRFPHRNDVLGRPSTPEEEAFLAEPGSSF